jgi:hypothetical protein
MDPAFPTMQLRVRLLEASPASEGKLAAVDAVEAVHRGLESAKVSLSRPSSHGRLPRRMGLTHRIRDHFRRHHECAWIACRSSMSGCSVFQRRHEGYFPCDFGQRVWPGCYRFRTSRVRMLRSAHRRLGSAKRVLSQFAPQSPVTWRVLESQDPASEMLSPQRWKSKARLA